MDEKNYTQEEKKFLNDWRQVDRILSELGLKLVFNSVEENGEIKKIPKLVTLKSEIFSYKGFLFKPICKIREGCLDFYIESIPCYEFKTYKEYLDFFKTLEKIENTMYLCNLKKLKVG